MQSVARPAQFRLGHSSTPGTGERPLAPGVCVSREDVMVQEGEALRIEVENAPTPEQAAAMVAGAVDVLARLLKAAEGDEEGEA